MTLHYANGQFTEGSADWPGWTWQTYGGDDNDRAFASAGYGEVAKIGNGYLLSVALHEHNREQRPAWLPPFFIAVEHGTGSEFISAATFPDALDLLARWAPAVSATLLTDAYESVFGGTRGGLIETLAGVKAAKDQITARAAGIRAEEAEARRRKERATHLATVAAADWIQGGSGTPARWALALDVEGGRDLHTELVVGGGNDAGAMVRVFRALAALGIAVPPGPGPSYWQQGLTEDQVAQQMTGRRVYVTDDGEITGAPPAAHP